MPDGFLSQSGLPHFVSDVRGFVEAVRFARPAMFWLTVVPVALAVVAWWQARRRKRTLTALGPSAALYGLRTRPTRLAWLTALASALGYALTIFGLAGPTWGVGEKDGVALGRDIVIVLDFSRSMLASDTAGPTRWQSAVAGADNLIESLRRDPGHRYAVIVFAGRPHLLTPLTTDADHVAALLHELDGARPPPETQARGPSGTRLGSAIASAVEAHDPRFRGAQDVILFSDGDDPVEDREWLVGVAAARRTQIPVHAVGLGGPERESPVTVRGRLLEFAEPGGLPDAVQTRLHEEVLTAISAQTGGQYLPSRQGPVLAGDFFRDAVERDGSRELSEDAAPQPRDRSAGFVGAGLLCLLAATLRGR